MTRILVLEPDDWYFRRDGLSAALATGAAPDEVRAAIEGVLRTDPGSQKRFDEEQLRGEVALWHGSMLEARDAFLRADLLAQDEGASRALPVTAGERLNVAEELGDEDEIRKITRGYVGARALTTPENNADGAMLTALRRHRILPDSDVLRIRDRWRADAKVYPAPLVWLDYEAGFATTEAEARDALASGVDAKISHGRLDVNAKLGRVLLLARRFADAVSRLERVAFSCAVFRDEESYVPLIAPAAYELGRAREGMGDPAGACDAYRRVLDLWSNATPRSTTAEAARSRFRDLRCKD